MTTPQLLDYHYPKVYRQLLSEIGEHSMIVLHDEGEYRHLRFRQPGTSMWHWDLITWPGSLAIRGDIGEGFIFTRETNMLQFFDHGQPDGCINAGYWAEKLARGSRSVRDFSADKFRDWLTNNEHDPALADDVERQDEAIEALNDAEIRWDYETPGHWEDYEHHFVLACHAILWGAKTYHRAHARTGTGEQ